MNKYLSEFSLEYDYKGSKTIDSEFFDLMNDVDPIKKATRINLAIKRAKKIYDRYEHRSPAKEESSTTVFC
ncbi:hypothetical protein MASR1M107_20440 [Ignavibacteriales bacterium]